MELLKIEDFKDLARFTSNVCISVYIPTHHSGMEVFEGEDIIRYKNIIKKIENSLENSGFEKVHQGILAQAKKLIEDKGFWRHQMQGLALFIAPNFFKFYLSGIAFEETVHINSVFYLKPIVPLLTENGKFYILGLSKKRVSLYRASKYTIEEVSVEGYVPRNMEEAVSVDETESTLQFHSGVNRSFGAGRSAEGAVFHGQGGRKDEEKSYVEIFLHDVDQGIIKMIGTESKHLMVAGVEYMASMYKNISKYKGMMSQALHGNPDLMEITDLHTRAIELAEPFFAASRKKAIHLCLEAPRNVVSENIEEIIHAAEYGKIRKLFIDSKANEIWGQYDQETKKLTVHKERGDGDISLINLAAIYTVINSGQVYLINKDKEEMPAEKNGIVALYRY